MRYSLHSILLTLTFLVISMLALNLPMAEAADVEAVIPQLQLSLSEEITAPVPGTEVTVNLLVHEGSFETADGVNAIQFTIEYDRSVAKVEKPVKDNIEVHADEFGIEIDPDPGVKWSIDAETIPGVGDSERLIIVIYNSDIVGSTLREPSIWPNPATLLTITFTVQSFQHGAVTDVVFLEGSSETFLLTLLDKFTILSADRGKISLRDSGSTEVLLSLPSTQAPPVPGWEVPIALEVEGGYEAIDLIVGVVLTIAYDSTVADIANDPPVLGTDIITHLDQFGVTDGWQVVLSPLRDDLVPPDYPELDKQLVVQMFNTNPDQFPALGAVLGTDLLTINFIVQSDSPGLSTRLLFIDELHSYFQKRDTSVQLGKLPVDLDYDPPGSDDDPHGDIALRVIKEGNARRQLRRPVRDSDSN